MNSVTKHCIVNKLKLLSYTIFLIIKLITDLLYNKPKMTNYCYHCHNIVNLLLHLQYKDRRTKTTIKIQQSVLEKSFRFHVDSYIRSDYTKTTENFGCERPIKRARFKTKPSNFKKYILIWQKLIYFMNCNSISSNKFY